MKVDGKALAKEHAKHSRQPELRDEGKVVEKEVLDMGNHIQSMYSVIEAIHNKDAPKAHEHLTKWMSEFTKPNAGQDQPK